MAWESTAPVWPATGSRARLGISGSAAAALGNAGETRACGWWAVMGGVSPLVFARLCEEILAGFGFRPFFGSLFENRLSRFFGTAISGRLFRQWNHAFLNATYPSPYRFKLLMPVRSLNWNHGISADAKKPKKSAVRTTTKRLSTQGLAGLRDAERFMDHVARLEVIVQIAFQFWYMLWWAKVRSRGMGIFPSVIHSPAERNHHAHY
ncbi:hypothetical protein J2W14_000380 [Pseudarthrobacter oxydans]|uniref:hypothetical protein n=1 Tax=Pseudarthrobacter oxydans TaxID=1671 RepID=UPI002782CEEB|nr:hypothetical protein [Pseudarthrobacter oxydans]MDP9981004.1 hypothetical protein [Pseudarthrobacter oxydans]